jgi:hypothetical protein
MNMDLPRDPFEHMKKMMKQYSAAERALQQAQAMDPVFQLQKIMGATAFDALYGHRSVVLEAYERNFKEIAEAQRLTKQLRGYEEADRIEKLINPSYPVANEWRWIEAVRKAVAPFDPISDLIRAAESTSVLQKYRPFELERSLDIVARALAESTTLERATDEWSTVARLLRTVQELQAERDNWVSNGGELVDAENDDEGSEIVAAALPSEIGTSLGDLQVLLSAILTELRLHRSSPEQNSIFWNRVFPYLFTLIVVVLDPISDTYVKRAIDRFDPVPVTQPAREANKSINLQAREFKLTPMLLSELRFVNCKKKDLALRKTPRMNAATLPMKIPRGQPVQVLETKDSWTRIRWADSEQSFVIEGWVFTRYLKKFS